VAKKKKLRLRLLKSPLLLLKPRLLPLRLTLLLLLPTLLLLRLMPLPLRLTLLLLLLPPSNWQASNKNRPSGRFFFV
jgi:hypothetical protein